MEQEVVVFIVQSVNPLLWLKELISTCSRCFEWNMLPSLTRDTHRISFWSKRRGRAEIFDGFVFLERKEINWNNIRNTQLSESSPLAQSKRKLPSFPQLLFAVQIFVACCIGLIWFNSSVAHSVLNLQKGICTFSERNFHSWFIWPIDLRILTAKRTCTKLALQKNRICPDIKASV